MMGLLSLFFPRYASTLIYMLQATEYQPRAYLAWYWRTTDFRKVAHRGDLKRTKRARLLLFVLQAAIVLQLVLGVFVMWRSVQLHDLRLGALAGLIFLSYPLIWAHLILVPFWLARLLIARPKEKRLVSESQKLFGETKAVKIAVAGSYGKTTMKELLKTVLGEGKVVAATPANKNVAVSHARFAKQLTGKEEVLIIEYGEGAPGDVVRFNAAVQPTMGIITGLAPAHLDKYKTVEAAGRDIFTLADYVGAKNVFVNSESRALTSFLHDDYHTYNRTGALGWKVSQLHVDITGMKFTVTSGKHKLALHTDLIGEHLIGALVLCVALAKELGLGDVQIKAGIAKTRPFEHRMEPRALAGGWIIDDTYNGNLEGVRAGLELLKRLPAKRKTYVSPGLVEQGTESEQVHHEMGRLIAKAQPDVVVLMKNSVTEWIQEGLSDGGFSGELRVESDPLDFYGKIEHLIAVGDIVMMQNDWPDNYN